MMKTKPRHYYYGSLLSAISERTEEGEASAAADVSLTASIEDDDDDIHEENDDDEDKELLLREEILRKIDAFELAVDPDKGYRATEIKWWSFRRPHMRALHGSWMCFCSAWLIWFSMAPLLPAIGEEISMTKNQIWTSNLLALVGTIVLRLILGPLCDQYGAREILCGLVALCAIPCGLAGLLIRSYRSLLIVRALIGCVGGTLVPTQFWVSSLFAPSVAGVATATATGWGALGGGLAQVLVGSLLFPVLQSITGSTALAWRLALVVPAAIALSVAYFFYHYADDCPLGNYNQVKRAGLLQERSAAASFRSGIININAWILFAQFGATLGIELTMESGICLHLQQRFGLTTAEAAAYASLFGFMNLFARGLGGYWSDRLHRLHSLQGRLWIHMVLMFCEGLLIFGFTSSNQLATTIVWMVAFAAMGQAAMGTCFGIIPYLDPRSTGTIAGIVGAGGNLGGVLLANVFRTATHDEDAFRVMAWACIGTSMLTALIVVSGYRGMIFGKKQQQQHRKAGQSPAPQTLTTPQGPSSMPW